jgi:hypothetical protein
MWSHAYLKRVVLGLVFASAAFHAERAAADPVTVTGSFIGVRRFALIEEELDLVFPDFTIIVQGLPQLTPGFCLDGCGTGTPVPFTQTTGLFSGHSIAAPGLPSIDADVTGTLSFVGPTLFVDIGSDSWSTAFLSAPVQFSGLLKVVQDNRVLFNGTLLGSGTGSIVYENTFAGMNTRLGGFQYEIHSVAATPEPGSLLLLAPGVGWLAIRRRKSTEQRQLRVT